jgi:predicted nucleotidyltransferase
MADPGGQKFSGPGASGVIGNCEPVPNSLKEDMEQILIDLKKGLQEIAGDRIVRMVLYGSRARGDYSEGSDTDIAVIVRGLSREMKDTMLNRVADVEIEYLRSLSTLILSEEDFLLLKKRERRIAMDIDKEGVPL